ncbi:MAG: hypothetical protein LBB60_11125, partial [Desulfovibrio sp.]|nr:hypothetical protein [Desulfovibrio sp.]
MKCRKRICITAVLTVASLVCFFTPVRGDNASVTGTPRGGMVVEIACDGKQSEQPPVSFPHERHTQALQKEGVVSCGLCHRAEGQDNAFVFTYNAAEKNVLSAKKDAYHA